MSDFNAFKKISKIKIESKSKSELLKLCRTCLGEKNPKGLFEIHISGYRYSEMVTFCTGFETGKDDGLPQKVCSDCAELLPDFFSFYKKSQEAYRLLKFSLPYVPSATDDLLTPEKEDKRKGRPVSKHQNTLSSRTKHETRGKYGKLIRMNEEKNKKVLSATRKIIKSANPETAILDRKPNPLLLDDIKIENYSSDDNEYILPIEEVTIMKYDEIVYQKQEDLSSDEEQVPLSKIIKIERAKKAIPSSPVLETIPIDSKGAPMFLNELPIVPIESPMENGHNYLVDEGKACALYLPVFGCFNCDKHFFNQSALEEHNLTHANPHLFTKHCRFCNEQCLQTSILIDHLRSKHSDIKRFGCGYCTTKCKTERLLQIHMVGHTTDTSISIKSEQKKKEKSSIIVGSAKKRGGKFRANKLTCPQCRRTFTDKCLLAKHIKSHKKRTPYICENLGCKKYCFPTKYDLEVHVHVRHHSEVTVSAEGLPHASSFVCKFCEKVCSKRKNLTHHMLMHRPDKRFQCRYCDKAFNFRHHFIHHERIHTNENPYLCQECGRSYKTNTGLKIHRLKHADLKAYKCSQCPKAFKTQRQLSKHQDSHEGGKFMCSFCGKTFSSLHNLHNHTITQHEGARLDRRRGSPGGPGGAGGVCTICGVAQDSIKEMDAHMKTHTCQYFCPKCPKSFPITSALEKHIKTHLVGDRSHVCTECDAAFNRLEHLRGHVARLHGGPRPKQCPHCPKRFLLTSDLNPHIRTHTGEKPFICQFCQMGFKTSSSLTCHQRTHTGEKPYICNVCCVGFYTSGPLHLHMRKHFQIKAPTETCKASVPEDEETEAESSIVTKEPAEILQEDSHFYIQVIDEFPEDKSIKQ